MEWDHVEDHSKGATFGSMRIDVLLTDPSYQLERQRTHDKIFDIGKVFRDLMYAEFFSPTKQQMEEQNREHRIKVLALRFGKKPEDVRSLVEHVIRTTILDFYQACDFAQRLMGEEAYPIRTAFAQMSASLDRVKGVVEEKPTPMDFEVEALLKAHRQRQAGWARFHPRHNAGGRGWR